MGQRPLFRDGSIVKSQVTFINYASSTISNSFEVYDFSLSFFNKPLCFLVVYDHLPQVVFDHQYLHLSNNIRFDELHRNYFYLFIKMRIQFLCFSQPSPAPYQPAKYKIRTCSSHKKMGFILNIFFSRTVHRQTSRPTMSSTRDPPVQSRP